MMSDNNILELVELGGQGEGEKVQEKPTLYQLNEN